MANERPNQQQSRASDREAAIQKATDDITAALEKCSVDVVKDLPPMKQAISLASGMKAMRLALTDDVVQSLFMPLMGSSLGFRTDLDNKDKGYPIQVVRDCVIEALVRGFQVVGNEFNIIAERAYFTKEGFERRVAEFPGLTNLELFPGVPHMANGGALVPYRARWRLNGAPMELVRDLIKNDDGSTTDQRIPVRVNAGMGADAILGKAKRKLLAQILERLTGAKLGLNDGDVSDLVAEGVTVPEPNKPKAQAMVDEMVERQRSKRAVDHDPVTGEVAEPPKRTREPGED